MDVPIIGQSPVPLVGQKFDAREWFLTLMLICRYCDTQTPVLVTGASLGVCRHCGAQFQLAGLHVGGRVIPFDQVGFAVAHGRPPAPGGQPS